MTTISRPNLCIPPLLAVSGESSFPAPWLFFLLLVPLSDLPLSHGASSQPASNRGNNDLVARANENSDTCIEAVEGPHHQQMKPIVRTDWLAQRSSVSGCQLICCYPPMPPPDWRSWPAGKISFLRMRNLTLQSRPSFLWLAERQFVWKLD